MFQINIIMLCFEVRMGALKMQDQKMQDLKMKDHRNSTGSENGGQV